MEIQVIGGGSWGLALARHLAQNQQRVRLWCREEDDPETLRTTRYSPYYLTDVHLPETVEVAPDVAPTPDMVLYAVPSHAMRPVAARYVFPEHTVRISVAKGIENDTLKTMSAVLAEAAPGGPVVALSGPSHAEELAHDLPTSVVAASMDHDARMAVQQAFMGANLRVYTTPDITGVEYGGALKNVIAIAAGVCDGFQLGDSAKAALITRGLAEVRRLGEACGARPLTFAGLSGMGDLIVTCTSRHSRNRRLGEQLGQGQGLGEILGATRMVSEGVRTARSAHALAGKLGVDMPIAREVYAVLFEDRDPRDAIAALLVRDPKPEL